MTLPVKIFWPLTTRDENAVLLDVPVQVNKNSFCPAMLITIFSDPEGPLVPDHAPDAEQLFAFSETQVNVTPVPTWVLIEFVLKSNVGMSLLKKPVPIPASQEAKKSVRINRFIFFMSFHLS